MYTPLEGGEEMGRSKPKKPTRNQKDLIRKAGLDPADWLVCREFPDELRLAHKILRTTRIIMK